jgi:hypothetical protein
MKVCMEHVESQKGWIDKDLRGSYLRLYEANVSEFACRNWQKPRMNSARESGNLTENKIVYLPLY